MHDKKEKRYKITNKKNYSKPKSIWKPKYCRHKISYYRTSKTSYKLAKSIRQAKKVSQVGSGKISNRPLYNKMKKKRKYFGCKNNKMIWCF